MIRRLAVALLAVISVGSATPASATGFRYWTYWHGGATGWQFASSGPYFTYLKQDASVDGWRFSTSDPYGPLPPAPRTPSKYAELCHDAPRKGYVRLAIVIDFGTAADAPPGDTVPQPILQVACRVVPVGTDAFTALTSQNYKPQVTVRADPSSFICGIDGYPKTECANVNATAAPAPVPNPTTRQASAPVATPTSSTSPTSSTATPNTASPTTSIQIASSPVVSPTSSDGAATSTLTFSPDPISQATIPQTHSAGHWLPVAGGVGLIVLLGGLAARRSRRH